MSGRLVISKHKSYHVWNQDNVEKVMRDERLHKERLDAEAQREKDSLQEKNREVLLSSRDPASGGIAGEDVPPASGAEREIFNLFGDLKSAAAEEMARKVKRKEQEAKDALLLRQNGAAPWALGDGSREKSGKRAWYEALSSSSDPSSGASSSAAGITVMGKLVTGREEQGARSRDTARQRRLDPMAPLLHGGAGVWAEAKTDDGPEGCGAGGAHDRGRRSDKEDTRNRGRDGRHNKSKKEKKRSQERVAEEPAEDENARLLRELRRKRLDRERLERKKTAILLARHDIYGSS